MHLEMLSEIVIENVLIRVMNGYCCRYNVVDLKYNLDNQISQVDTNENVLCLKQ